MELVTTIIAVIATLLVTFGYVPQIVRGYRTKRMDDVSMPFLAIIASGVFFWIVYAILNRDMVFLIANIVILCFSSTLIVMKLRYAKK